MRVRQRKVILLLHTDKHLGHVFWIETALSSLTKQKHIRKHFHIHSLFLKVVDKVFLWCYVQLEHTMDFSVEEKER